MADELGDRPHVRQDGHLSEDARSYLISLRSNDAREAARDYANMDPALFRARLGPAVDEMLVTLRRLDRPTISKKQVAGLMTAGGIVLEAVLRGLEKWRT